MYKFHVCIHDDNVNCKDIYFKVLYNEYIIIADHPNTYSSLSITWSRWRYWTYPETLLSWYEYTIKKYWSDSTFTWFISINNVSNWCYLQSSYWHNRYENCNENLDIGSIIENIRWNDSNTNGTYTLTVSLIDKNWEIAQGIDINYDITDVTASTTFTIEANNELNITSTANDRDTIQNLPINFAWNGTGTSFSWYNYYVTTDSECNNSNKIFEWNTGNIEASLDENLSNWSYRLCVNMFDTSNTLIASWSRTFSVNVSSNLSISSPIWSQSNLPINFTWNSTGDPFSWYTYYVSTSDSCNNSNIVPGFSGTKTDKSVSFTWNLPNWSYILCVNMHSNIDNSIIASGNQNFSVNMNPTLTIIKPNDTESSASTEFSWKPNIPSSY